VTGGSSDERGRVLVTGGEGLVGSAVVARLLESGREVTTLTPPGATPHPGVRSLAGDARDRDAVAAALDGVTSVIHLAAIPRPWDDPAETVFGNNTLATFTVLWTAAEHGVRRFAAAGSVNATGLIFNKHHPVPQRFPLDESSEPDLADPYSLSKYVDEYTLKTVCRRFDASGVILRLPVILSPGPLGNAVRIRTWLAPRAEENVGDGWSWMDVRDAAEAFRLAIEADYQGVHVLQVGATTTIQESPTDELLDRYAPGVPRRERYPETTAPLDTSRARELLGFSPVHHDPFTLEREDAGDR